MQNVTVPLLKSTEGVVSDDGKHLLLKLRATTGSTFDVALKESDITRLIAFLIESAAKSAAKKKPDTEETQELTVSPIIVKEIGIAHGRSDTEALLIVRSGIFQMSFAAEISTLKRTLQDLEANNVQVQRSSKPN